MLDLKAKLLKAGLVTEDQVKKVEEEQAAKKQKKQAASSKQDPHDRRDSMGDVERWRKRLDELKAAGKSEQYDAIRGWVERHRLDSKTAVPSEEASRFHFAKGDGAIGHVTIEPDMHAKLSSGEAGLIAFMGHNGLEHAVVPADLARDVAHVKPEWLRSLAGVTDQASDSQSTPASATPESSSG